MRAMVADETADAVLIRYEVTDTGIGITPEEQQRLFQPFSQADSSTTRRYGGTGLGLAISRQLVGLMDGEIGVESTSGVGSTFWFTARLPQPVAGTAMVPVAADAGLQGVRVLIVDDNATNRTVLRKQVTAWGMSADCADGGPSALTLLHAAASHGQPYAVALLDMQMPDMDGLELARTIAADAALATIQLVLLTSGGFDEGDVRQAHIVTALTKPVRQSALYGCLTAVMGTPGNRGLPEVPAPPQDSGLQSTIGAVESLPLILVAEDNMVNQKVALYMLRKIGYRVDVVATGSQAVDAVARRFRQHGDHYAAVLMDCQMPVMDGYAATAAIHTLEGGAHTTPIIAMTANALAGERERCLAAGMDDYIAKPVTSEILRTVLQRWIVPDAAEPQNGLAGSSAALGPEAALDASVLASVP